MSRPTSCLRRVPVLLLLVAAGCEKSTKLPGANGAAPQPAGSPAAAADDAKPMEDPPFGKVEGERGLRQREAGALEGYTLIAPLRSMSIHLVDMDGKVVHSWATRHQPGAVTRFLPNGHVLRGANLEGNPRFHGGGIGGRIEELDWDGKVVWEYELATAERTLHHDFTVMPNGNLLAIAWEYHAPEEAFELGRAANRIHDEGLWCDVVLEIEPVRPSGGKIVWTWRTCDHLVQDERELGKNYGAPADFPGRIDVNADHRFDPGETEAERLAREERERQMQGIGYAGGKEPDPQDAAHAPDAAPKPSEKYDADWLHTNAVDYLPEEDLIVLSSPHLSEVWVIDHGTTTTEAANSKGGRRGKGGDLLWRWGNPRNYGMGDEQSTTLFAQHNPTWVRGERAGQYSILVFDNGDSRPGGEYSAVLELALPFDPAKGFLRDEGWPFGPKEAQWSYTDRERFFSPFISGAERLSNGNTLICEGARGRVFEVTPAGLVVWDFYNPHGGEIEPSKQGGKAPSKALFRATRLPKDHPGLAGRF
jgi:hypothetical protein